MMGQIVYLCGIAEQILYCRAGQVRHRTVIGPFIFLSLSLQIYAHSHMVCTAMMCSIQYYK